MAFAVDTEKLNSPDMVTMDIGKPPIKQIPYQAYPKMLYLHPKDKSREHLTKVVSSEEEKTAAMAQGWRVEPHIPVPNVASLHADFEAEIPEPEVKRGPGRPRHDSL